MALKDLFKQETRRHSTLSSGQVIPDGERCVQCGICSFHCPIGINVRSYVWENKPVQDSHCLTCGECVARCPRGVLRFERVNLSMEIQK